MLHTLTLAVSAFFLGTLTAFAVGGTHAPDQDRARLAPHIYQVVLENEHVRVLRVTVRSGIAPPVHSHPGRVLISMDRCAERIATADGGEQVVTYEAGEVSWGEAETHGGTADTVDADCHWLEVKSAN